jgi:hypothetical protein
MKRKRRKRSPQGKKNTLAFTGQGLLVKEKKRKALFDLRFFPCLGLTQGRK